MADENLTADDDFAGVDDEANTEAVDTEALDDAPEDDAEDVDAEASDDDGEGDRDAEEGEGDDGDEEEDVELNLAGNVRKFKANAPASEILEDVQSWAKEMEAGVTRRNQELAEQRKAVEARTEALGRIQEMDDEAIDLFTQAQSLDRAVYQMRQRLQQIDRNQDPNGYRFLSDDIAAAEQRSVQAKQQLSQREQQSTMAKAAEVERLQREGEAAVRKQLPKVDPEKTIAYAVKTAGINEETARKQWAVNPAVFIAFEKARQFDEMKERAKAPPPKPKAAKPVKSRGRQTTSRDLSNPDNHKSADDFLRWERQQLARKRQARA